MGSEAATRVRQWAYRGPRRRLAFVRYRRHLDRVAAMPGREADAFRVRALRELLVHAHATVPFQRDRLDAAGLDPARLSSLDDLQAVAPVAKADLRAHGEEMVSTAAKNVMWLGTSGSSGEPFRYAVDPFFHTRSDAARAHIYRMCGFRRGVAVEMYAATGSSTLRDPGVAGFDRHIVDYGLPVEQRMRTLIGLSPDLLYGNRSHLLELADALEARGRSLANLRHVFSSSEPLSSADRSRLREVFGVDVLDVYGLGEVSSMCFETSPLGGYRVLEGRVVVEVLNDGRPVAPGELGEVVVTGLDNRVMPFIRYATGDLAVLASQSAPSGHAGMVIERIEGRLVDTIRRLDGTPVTYWALGTSATWSSPVVAGCVRQWQVVQEARDRVVVRVAPAEQGLHEAARVHIVTAIAAAVGPGFHVELQAVGHIAVEPNGKYKAVKVQPGAAGNFPCP